MHASKKKECKWSYRGKKAGKREREKKNRMAREGESEAWWVARRSGQMLNPQMWSLYLFKAFLAGLWRKQERFEPGSQRGAFWIGGGDAVTTLEVILRGKVLWGSSTNRHHKVFNLSLRSTAQESERDYKQNERWSEKEKEKERPRWLLKRVSALV